MHFRVLSVKRQWLHTQRYVSAQLLSRAHAARHDASLQNLACISLQSRCCCRCFGAGYHAGSVHLYFHPEWPDIKLAQAAALCSEAVEMMTAEGLQPADVPIILGGDWNSLWRKYTPDQWDTKVC